MKIGIDISQIVYGTGVSVYTSNLVRNLIKLDRKNEYILFGGSLRQGGALTDFTSGLKGNFSTKFFPIPPTALDFLWNRVHILPIETFTGKLDVFHSSDWAQAPSKAFKITTVHDLVPLKYPKESHPKIVSAHKARLKWVKKQIDVVIAVSESTKKDLIGLGVSKDKIRVIYEAPEESFTPQESSKIDKSLKKLGITGDYLLAVGRTPRKNIDRIITAYRKLKQELKLVIIGGGRAKNENEVIFTGFVTHEDRLALFVGAQALVYPSLYEGFGLPILEAMAVGTPVVTSKVSSMPEVAGNAAILVNPKETESITKGIQKALGDKVNLRKKGLAQARKFSWKRAAAQTLQVYNEVR